MSLHQLFGFNVIEDDSISDGNVLVINNNLHLSSNFAIKIERTVGTNGSYIFHRLHPSARASISDIYSQIQSQLNISPFNVDSLLKPIVKYKEEIKLPNIEFVDSVKDYTYLETCESCSDEKKCRRVPISNTITISYSPEQLFINTKELEEKTKFVCQYCFNYLKQTGVFE